MPTQRKKRIDALTNYAAAKDQQDTVERMVDYAIGTGGKPPYEERLRRKVVEKAQTEYAVTEKTAESYADTVKLRRRRQF